MLQASRYAGLLWHGCNNYLTKLRHLGLDLLPGSSDFIIVQKPYEISSNFSRQLPAFTHSTVDYLRSPSRLLRFPPSTLKEGPHRVIYFVRLLQHYEMARINLLNAQVWRIWPSTSLSACGCADGIISRCEQENRFCDVGCRMGDS